ARGRWSCPRRRCTEAECASARVCACSDWNTRTRAHPLTRAPVSLVTPGAIAYARPRILQTAPEGRSPMGKLDDRIALVTGGSRGIGRGIALEMAREGAHVAVNYRRDEAAALSTVEEIKRMGRRAIAVQADVSEWPAVQTMVERVLGELGDLDIVVANSGV